MNENQTDLSQLDNSIVPLLAVDCLITPAALAAELVGHLNLLWQGSFLAKCVKELQKEA